MQIRTLDELLGVQLQEIYDAETQLLKALPAFSEAAQSPSLKQRFSEHLETTKVQMRRLEDIAEEYDLSLTGVSDAAMSELIKNSQGLIARIGDPVLLDTAILGGADKIEHYEMAAYQSALDVAKKLGRNDVAEALQNTISEEKTAAQSIESNQAIQ